MRFITLLFILTSVACAKLPGSESTAEDGASIASIPEGCAQFSAPSQNATGWHEFTKGSGNVLWADGYNCGIREGKLCSYFVHNPDSAESNFKYDTRCE